MLDLYECWLELEDVVKTKNNELPVFRNVYTSKYVDFFIQTTNNCDYSIILHINENNNISINKEISGIKINTVINKAVDEEKPSIIIENINKSLINIFKAFSASLYEYLNESDESLEYIIDKVICDYKSYFSGSTKELSDIEQQGLYGELLFLKEKLIEGEMNVVDCWEGVYKNKHDFVFKNNSVEIKTTRNQSRLNVHISNENQLDDSQVNSLQLCVYRLEKLNIGKTIYDLSKEIMELLPDNKKDTFKSKLIMAGLNIDVEANYIRFKEIHRYIFNIDNEFPKINKEMCGDKIFEVKYYISLDGINALDEVVYNE